MSLVSTKAKKNGIFVGICILCLLAVSEAEAEMPGWVNGAVYDSTTLAPIAGAQVEGSEGQTTLTDANGYYIMLHPPGVHTFTATAPGYQPYIYEGLTVPEGGFVNLDFTMFPEGYNPDAPDAPETITYPETAVGDFTVTWATVSSRSGARAAKTTTPAYRFVRMAVAHTNPISPGRPTSSIRGPRAQAMCLTAPNSSRILTATDTGIMSLNKIREICPASRRSSRADARMVVAVGVM